MKLGEIITGEIPHFSFKYGKANNRHSIKRWKISREDISSYFRSISWSEPDGNLRVMAEVRDFPEYSARDWVLWLENCGESETGIVRDLRPLDLALEYDPDIKPKVIRTRGAPSDPSDFTVSTTCIEGNSREIFAAGGGRSSNRDFPFIKIDLGESSLILAIGWSGQWQAVLEGMGNGRMRLNAGMEGTEFLLHPGERVRTPRILALYWEGDPLECNSRFRQLILDHYVPDLSGEKPLPVLFCNTCFTRRGAWLNECNAENQISLIRSLAPLGLHGVITDAGWFEGRWPSGVGNWYPRKDACPEGIAPVAKAAMEAGMVYGLWFEPERVSAGSLIYRRFPWWLLSKSGDKANYLLDFGRKEVREYMFTVISDFMKLPGFCIYRQDFNLDPLEYWIQNDPPERRGITEMKYIEGLYAFWDRIAGEHPDCLREGCASGGRRIDLETISRFHIHQKTDYWFDNQVDQESIWGLGQYLPNSCFVVHLDRLDDDSFNSTMASSLCIGWMADDPQFDMERAIELTDRYRNLRHLLVGSWYPLTSYPRRPGDWLAFQFHRDDLNEGMVLAYRRQSLEEKLIVYPRKIVPSGNYLVKRPRFQKTEEIRGSKLARLEIEMPVPGVSELIYYRAIGAIE